MKKLFAVFIVILMAPVAYLAFDIWQDHRDSPGPPTPLAAGETPLAAVCRLRAEFLALPEPVHQGIKEHSPRKEWKFAVGTTTYGPYWEIRPTEATRAFVRSHSRLEIVAAVGPYVSDPALGPKAVAVLAALPIGSRNNLWYTSPFARILDKNSWETHDLRTAHSSLLTVYGEANTTDRITATPPRAGATLEAAIVQPIAALYQSAPDAFTAVDLSDQRRYPNWETTIATGPLPTVSAEFQAYMKRWPRDWLATVLFPYAQSREPFRSSPREKLVWIMGREAEYWPFSASTGFPREKHELAWEREVGEFARGVCARSRTP